MYIRVVKKTKNSLNLSVDKILLNEREYKKKVTGDRARLGRSKMNRDNKKSKKHQVIKHNFINNLIKLHFKIIQIIQIQHWFYNIQYQLSKVEKIIHNFAFHSFHTAILIKYLYQKT